MRGRAPTSGRPVKWRRIRRLPVTTAGCAEKVRSQFLSLRQLRCSRLFSVRRCWELSPVLAAISVLDSGLLNGRARPSTPNGSILSRALDSAYSVRFSKFECFERLMNSDEMGFCKSSRAGKSIRFRNRHIEVRFLPPQPSSPASDPSLQPSPHRPGNPGFFRHSTWSPECRSPNFARKIAESLQPFPEKIPFCRDYRRRLVRSGLPPESGRRFR